MQSKSMTRREWSIAAAALLIIVGLGWFLTGRSHRSILPQLDGPSPRALIEGNLFRPVAPLASKQLTTLIMVAGHGVHLGRDYVTLRTNEAAWDLESYQMKNGQIDAFVQHIERGVKEAAADPHSLLIFSGGETRPVSRRRHLHHSTSLPAR
jgi:hypothetical protein